jgi:Flp pilus assembly protein TadD
MMGVDKPAARGLRRILAVSAAATIGLAICQAGPTWAGLFGHHAAPRAGATITDAQLAQIQRAMDEERYVDAGRLLDGYAIADIKDPRLNILTGDLALARGRFEDAITEFKTAEESPATRAASYQGEGIALSQMGRSDEAMIELNKAVTADPSAWRAWNALGGEYDTKRNWTEAEAAYDHALSDSDASPIVLNNRGFSRMLQNRLDDSVADFVAALGKKPDLAAARNNLRLALAMKGEYDRATASGAADDKAALLNNAGFAAILRGDYVKAEDLLTQAMKTKGEYYARASENLDLARSLAARTAGGPGASH